MGRLIVLNATGKGKFRSNLRIKYPTVARLTAFTKLNTERNIERNTELALRVSMGRSIVKRALALPVSYVRLVPHLEK